MTEETTPKIEVDAEDADGEGRSMLEESSTTTTLPDDEVTTTPRSESESTVPSVSQEGSTWTPETEVTALPNIDADEDAEMTTLSQSPPSLGPSNEGSGAPDAEVTSSPVDADTPGVPEDGAVTTIIPDAVVTLLTTVRPTTQLEDGGDTTDTTDAPSAEEEQSPEVEEGTTLA